MAITPSASYSLTVRAAIKNRPGMLGLVTSAIGEAGGDIRAVDIIPSVFNKKVAPAVAREVVRAAQRSGLARRRRRAGYVS
jgi:hypothetical protein